MKKPKLSLGKDGIKGLFRRHIEKMLFGVALLLVAAFTYLGYSLESFPENKSPEQLKQLASRAVTHINEPTAEELKKERIPRDGLGGQYELRVQEARNAADPNVYAISVPWDPPPGAPGSKREDPTYLAPIKLETVSLTGALCVKAPEDAVNPLDELENAPSKETGSRDSSRSRRDRRNSGGGYPGMPGMDSMGGDSRGSGMFGPGGPGGMYGPDAPGGRGRGRGDDDDRARQDSRSSAARRYPADKVCGYRPGGVGGMGGMGGGYPGMGMNDRWCTGHDVRRHDGWQLPRRPRRQLPGWQRHWYVRRWKRTSWPTSRNAPGRFTLSYHCQSRCAIPEASGRISTGPGKCYWL
jgi:hypothetical protein